MPLALVLLMLPILGALAALPGVLAWGWAAMVAAKLVVAAWAVAALWTGRAAA